MFYESVNALTYDHKNNLIFAGTRYGKILILDENLNLLQDVCLHSGMINGVAVCPERNLIASVAEDRTIVLAKYDIKSCNISRLLQKNIRDLGDDYADPIHSTSQAIDIHPNEPRLITRTGNSCFVELDFDGEVLSTVRGSFYDIITTKYSNCGTYALFGTTNGCIGLYANGHLETFTSPKNVIETFHWFEQIADNEFIAACDQRFLVRVKVHKSDTYGLECQFGDVFTKDDLEHVTAHENGRVLASSFDRNVYDIDPVSLNPKKIAFEAPFKARWIKFSAQNPSIAFVQVRDGSIIKFDCDTGERLAIFKKTPPAIWSCCRVNGRLMGAGEEGFIFNIDIKPNGATLKSTTDICQQLPLQNGYFKRIEAGKNGQALAGSTCGKGFLIDGPKTLQSYDFKAPVRDITFYAPEKCFYVALENGQLLRTGKAGVSEIFRSKEPLWSLAISPDHAVLAFGERGGSIYLMDLPSHTIIEQTMVNYPSA